MKALLPVYFQIKQTIKNRIINRVYKPGEKIPSENELAEEFKVNRLTVRQAIFQLVQEGFLTARRGSGTFVTRDDTLINSFNLEFTGFMDDLFYQVSKSSTKSVQVCRIVAPPAVREKLEITDAGAEIVQVKRVRFKGGKSFAYTVNYIPEATAARIKEAELWERPLLQIMEQDLGIHFTEAFQTIQATFADQETAERLEIAPGSPILVVERIMYTHKRKPVEFVQSSYRGDVYKYIVRLKNVKKRVSSVWVHQAQ